MECSGTLLILAFLIKCLLFTSQWLTCNCEVDTVVTSAENWSKQQVGIAHTSALVLEL